MRLNFDYYSSLSSNAVLELEWWLVPRLEDFFTILVDLLLHFGFWVFFWFLLLFWQFSFSNWNLIQERRKKGEILFRFRKRKKEINYLFFEKETLMSRVWTTSFYFYFILPKNVSVQQAGAPCCLLPGWNQIFADY